MRASGSGSKSATADVYETLRGWLMEGRIPPGERLTIDALARELGVSATPVREAIGRLEGDNLVVWTSGRGAVASPVLDFSELKQLYEFRLLIEPWAARCAAVQRLSNPGAFLSSEIAAFEALVGSGADLAREKAFAHDMRFHESVVAATENAFIVNAYEQSHCHLHIFRLEYTATDVFLTIGEHRAMAKAIEDCDPAAAAAVAEEHIRNSFERAAAAFRKGAVRDTAATPSG
ncbi:MAG: GntR family transcriptional regulator [Actinobacteria bacterium]|nr:GntR family transcriptional regulator [Actinomycetota bacterium]